MKITEKKQYVFPSWFNEPTNYSEAVGLDSMFKSLAKTYCKPIAGNSANQSHVEDQSSPFDNGRFDAMVKALRPHFADGTIYTTKLQKIREEERLSALKRKLRREHFFGFLNFLPKCIFLLYKMIRSKLWITGSLARSQDSGNKADE